MNINFAFIRHGFGCHNYINNFNKEIRDQYSNKVDPVLTGLGKQASVSNGEVIADILKSLSFFTKDPRLQINTIHIIGCSPLIRCMETAYYMTREWHNPPKKIYVFPFLREIDEGSDNKYSNVSRYNIDNISSYAMATINEQKDYLQSQGILEFFDFSFIEFYYKERNEPGDIPTFINWFNNSFLPLTEYRPNLNAFIITHSGVLHDFSGERFYNNSGIVVNTVSPLSNGGKTLSNQNINKFVSLNKFLPNTFFIDYMNPKYNKKL